MKSRIREYILCVILGVVAGMSNAEADEHPAPVLHHPKSAVGQSHEGRSSLKGKLASRAVLKSHGAAVPSSAVR